MKILETIKEEIISRIHKDNVNFLIQEMKKVGIEKLPYSYASLKPFVDESLYSLPEGLEVGDSLDLIESSVEFLPKGLKVGRDLYIDETPLTKYTDEELREMIKPGFIKGEILR